MSSLLADKNRANLVGMANKTADKETASLSQLYPDLDEEQLKEVEVNLKKYAQLAIQIYEDILLDPDAYKEFKDILTLLDEEHRMKKINSSP